jgi:hypothetical protein
LKVTHEALNRPVGERVRGEWHIQTVNSLHSRLRISWPTGAGSLSKASTTTGAGSTSRASDKPHPALATLPRSATAEDRDDRPTRIEPNEKARQKSR